MRHPITLRQISLLRSPQSPATGAVYLHELTAHVDAIPIDAVTISTQFERQPALFYLDEAIQLSVRLQNSGPVPVTGALVLTEKDFEGVRSPLHRVNIAIPAHGAISLTHTWNAQRLGAFETNISLTCGDRTRTWRIPYAISRPGKALPHDHDAVFGCCASVRGFPPEQLGTVFRLNHDAGIRWTRFGFRWAELEPEPNAFAWNPAQTAPGRAGRALDCRGGAAPLEVPACDALACQDGLTIAAWLRARGPNATWQSPVVRSLGTSGRSYGLYLDRRGGKLRFTGSFKEHTGRPFSDAGINRSLWDNQWHHIAVTYAPSSGDMVFYVDGEHVGAEHLAGGRLRDDGASLRFGHCYDGLLDDVALYGRELPQEQIRALMGGKPAAEGLVGHWTFDSVDAPERDSSGHGRHAVCGEPSCIAVARRARKHGIRTLGILGFPPRWASTAPPDAERPWVYKPDLEALSRFVEAVTRHCRGLVDHWEIWNEPNIPVFWMPEPDPEAYFDVVKVAYAAAKRGNPDCTVIAPGLAGPGHSPTAMAYLDRLIELGLPNYCDAISVHPYRHRTTPEASDLEGDLRHIAEFSAQHGPQRQLWVTELCWATHLGVGVTEARAARMLGRGVPIALGTGLMDRIIWFRFHDPGLDRFYLEHNCALCRNDLLPKPEYFAYRTCSTLLEGSRPLPTPTTSRPVWTRLFAVPTGTVQALWTTEGSRLVAVDVGKQTATLVDLMGNETTCSARDGTVLIEACETTCFLRLPPGLRPTAAQTVVALTPEQHHGFGTRLVLPSTLTNPFDTPETLSLRLSDMSGAHVASESRTVPPHSTVAVALEVEGGGVLPLGRHRFTCDVRIGTTSCRQTVSFVTTGVKRNTLPLAHWTFDTAGGDASGNGHDAVLQNIGLAPGRSGNALRCTGRGMAVVPDSRQLDLPEEVTICLWFKLKGSTGTWQSLVTKFLGNQSRNYGIYLCPDATGPGFSTSFENADYPHTDCTAKTPLLDGAWHHLAVSVSALDQNVVLYVDGELAVKRAVALGLLKTNDEPILIGQGVRGLIDDVRIYGWALPQATIRDVMGGSE
ncbi:MAG: hypothetical protein HON70_06095 [Lentisphaerae bacterium]|nr:hypothetical protein [Lentisphaerota bacterium]